MESIGSVGYPDTASRKQQAVGPGRCSPQIQFLLGHASVLTTERYLGCKQNLGHPVNDLFDIKTNVQTQEVSLGSTASQATAVKEPLAEDVGCRSGGAQERQVSKNELHSVRKNNLEPTCADNGFLTEWDGAA